MKRILLLPALSAALLFTSTTANAQVPVVSKVLPKVTLGVKLGANMQQLSGGSGFDKTYKPGITGGLFLSVSKNKMGVRLEGLIKTARIDVFNNTGHVNLIALDVPLLFEYKLIPRVWLQVGPQFTALLAAKDNNSNDVKTAFKSNDISGVGGIEVTLPLRLTVGARYILGFTNQNTGTSGPVNGVSTVNESWKNRGIQLYLGFRFI